MNLFGLVALVITSGISIHRLLRCTVPQVNQTTNSYMTQLLINNMVNMVIKGDITDTRDRVTGVLEVRQSLYYDLFPSIRGKIIDHNGHHNKYLGNKIQRS